MTTSKVSLASLALVVAAACGGGGGHNGDDAAMPDSIGVSPDGAIPMQGHVGSDVHVDHAGWRTGDQKIAIVVNQADGQIELHRSDDTLVSSYPMSATATDDDSGDVFRTVDFSDVTTPGDYYLYLPGAQERSYTFHIGDDAFATVGAVVMKSFYFQRCNHDKALPYAGDALGAAAGIGGQWVDGACHAGDSTAPAGPGSPDHGALDVHGGWHDAGDYQKTLWGRGVPEMLFAYEINPGAWSDGQLDLPESGNGVPDILDELSWELDFYLRMQRPDGHFMTSVKGNFGTINQPPSASDEQRVYFDVTSPSGNGWSGGGVTLATATGNAVLSLAHAAIVFAGHDAARAASYGSAAKAGWTWLSAQTLTDAGELRLRAAAAAAVWRLDNSITSAKTIVAAFPWATWDGQAGGGATPGEGVIAAGAWHVLANPNATTQEKADATTGVASVIVDGAFSEAGAYGGMFGGQGNGWDYSWGSNRNQAEYGANLMMAAHFGILSGHPLADVVAQAEQHLHHLFGLNPLDMVYETSMEAYGAEHSAFHLYHAWFSYTGADGDHGNAQYDGKPPGVVEPLYPYYVDDASTSTFGPAPGLMVGGPNFYYDGQYTIPDRQYPAKAFRDFSVGCDWDGANCRASSWELTEPDDGYQGPLILLVSFFMP